MEKCDLQHMTRMTETKGLVNKPNFISAQQLIKILSGVRDEVKVVRGSGLVIWLAGRKQSCWQVIGHRSAEHAFATR